MSHDEKMEEIRRLMKPVDAVREMVSELEERAKSDPKAFWGIGTKKGESRYLSFLVPALDDAALRLRGLVRG